VHAQVSVCFHNLVTYAQRLQDLYSASVDIPNAYTHWTSVYRLIRRTWESPAPSDSGVSYELENPCTWRGSNPEPLALETDALPLRHWLSGSLITPGVKSGPLNLKDKISKKFPNCALDLGQQQAEHNGDKKGGICIAPTQPFQAALGAESRECYPGTTTDRQTQLALTYYHFSQSTANQNGKLIHRHRWDSNLWSSGC
jgi:hypothetical protein